MLVQGLFNFWQQLFRFACALCLLAVCARTTVAAPDDTEPPPNEQAEVNQGNFMVAEANFDQWVFQGTGTADAARERIKARLRLQFDELARVCELTDAQKRKLELAAQGDMIRFFEQVEEVRRKFLEVRKDQNAFGQIWQEIQPLQLKMASGLFGDKSFYAKTLYRTLDTDQMAKYQTVVEDRRRFRFRASVEVAITTLEGTVALSGEQRDALITMLVDKAKPPLTFGQYDYWFVMYRLARLPEKNVKPLFDERQWERLRAQFNQFRNMRATLVHNGAIAADDIEWE